MNNHVHLVIKEHSSADISLIMKKILSTYACWFNKKYSRNGVLIANRYKSTSVDNDKYLLTLIRYIHQNPFKAGIVSEHENYRWSSYRDYITTKNKMLTDTQFILEFFLSDNNDTINNFKTFHNTLENHDFTIAERITKTDETIKQEIITMLKGNEIYNLLLIPKSERNGILTALLQKGFSIRQIVKATGISRGVVQNV